LTSGADGAKAKDITRWRFARREEAEAFANAFVSVVVK
jgi:hypothetical protein